MRAKAVATRGEKPPPSCGERPLIVAPTHAECRAIANAVRDQQKNEGLLGAEDQRIQRLGKVNLTESQRRDPINYQVGQVVEFHRRARGRFKSGERWEVVRRGWQGVVVVRDGQAKLLPLAQAKSFDLYKSEEIALAAGDRIRITKNFRADLFTDSKVALREAVTRPSEGLSPYEMISKNGSGRDWLDVAAGIHGARLRGRKVTPVKSGREAMQQTERAMER